MSLLGNRLNHALRHLSPFHYQKNTVSPDPDHLYHLTRVFRSPFSMAQELIGKLMADQAFRSVVPQNDREYLIQLAVCDDELRANIYRVEEDPDLCPIYDAAWANNGVFSYHVMPNGEYTQVIREMPGRYYHINDVRVSYSRKLSIDELMEIDACRLHRN